MTSNTKSSEDKFFIVSADILPEAIVKTAKVKEILLRSEASTINEAVEKVNLSRSAFYKYKDGVFPVQSSLTTNIVTISLILNHHSGILSEVLNTIADTNASILTINQGIPLHGVANVSISFETNNLEGSLSSLLDKLQDIYGVVKVDLIGET